MTDDMSSLTRARPMSVAEMRARVQELSRRRHNERAAEAEKRQALIREYGSYSGAQPGGIEFR